MNARIKEGPFLSGELGGAFPGTFAIVCLAAGACTTNTLDLFDADRGLLGHWAFDESRPQVARWMRAMMIPPAEIEDVAQEVFLVAQRKLSGFRGDNVGGWLYRITDLTARNYRRPAWFKHFFAREPSDDALGAVAVANTPAVTLEQKEDQRALARMLSRMSAKRRETLIMFEVEG